MFKERVTFTDHVGSEKGDLYSALWDRVIRCSHLNSAAWLKLVSTIAYFPYSIWRFYKPCIGLLGAKKHIKKHLVGRGVGRGGGIGGVLPFLGANFIHFLYKVLGLRSVQTKLFKN